MKFSVAPESSSVAISALLDAACMYALMVIDFLSDKYTRSSVPLLIQAAQIRAFKNPSLGFPRLVLRSFGAAFLCLPERVRGLWRGVPRLSCLYWAGILLDRPILVVLGTLLGQGPIRYWP
jgi:hypothetical protein